MPAITFEVETWWSPERAGLRALPDVTVGAAAELVLSGSGRPFERPSFVGSDGVVMDRSLTLAEAGVKDGDVLELTDVGGAV